MDAQDSTTQLVQQSPEKTQDVEETPDETDPSIALDIEEGVVPVKDLEPDDASPDSNGIGESTPLTLAADTTHDNIELGQVDKKKVHLSKEVYNIYSFFCRPIKSVPFILTHQNNGMVLMCLYIQRLDLDYLSLRPFKTELCFASEKFGN